MARDGSRRGRTTRLTPKVADSIVTAVRSGAPLEVAAQAVGIPPGTFWEWMARGEDRDPDRPGSPLYADFAERVRKAEAEIHVLTIGTIRNAAVQRGSWEAARAWLRMRWPKHYAERTEVSGPEGKAIPLEIAGILEGMTDDDLDRLAARLRASGAPGGRAGEEEEG
jgi:hypothetical protein